MHLIIPIFRYDDMHFSIFLFLLRWYAFEDAFLFYGDTHLRMPFFLRWYAFEDAFLFRYDGMHFNMPFSLRWYVFSMPFLVTMICISIYLIVLSDDFRLPLFHVTMISFQYAFYDEILHFSMPFFVTVIYILVCFYVRHDDMHFRILLFCYDAHRHNVPSTYSCDFLSMHLTLLKSVLMYKQRSIVFYE